jgi:hypothetical protein
MAEAEYQCWGDDKEDLTNKVTQELAKLPKKDSSTVFYSAAMKVAGKAADRGPRKIMVTCGKGHENVFTIED